MNLSSSISKLGMKEKATSPLTRRKKWLWYKSNLFLNQGYAADSKFGAFLAAAKVKYQLKF